ncbi:hypothetical protein WP1W18C01_10300 [Stenotrophomonas maltophilia]|nr:hypothetical protein WP1W18C01_10300 [Stenotrophomonas maltophilia]SSM88181.1 Uncharacterised protein [Acinetobacter baumannii]
MPVPGRHHLDIPAFVRLPASGRHYRDARRRYTRRAITVANSARPKVMARHSR